MSSDALLTILLIAGVAAAAGLVGIWAAVSEGHWFWRSAAVWGCVAVLVPVRVWEPAMVFAVALPVVVVMIGVVRSWRGAVGGSRNAAEGVPYRGVRFGLLDVFLLMLLVGLSLVAARKLWQAPLQVGIYEIVIPAIVMALLTAVAWWVVRGPWRVVAALVAVLAAVGGAWLIWPGTKWLYRVESLGVSMYGILPGVGSGYAEGLTLTIVALAVQAMLMCLGIVVARHHWQSGHWGVRLGVGVAAMPIVLLAGWLYWQLFTLWPFPPALTCEENQAERIFELAARVSRLSPLEGAASSLSPSAASELNQVYEELLPLLERDNCMPFDVERESTVFFQGESTDRMMLLRKVARVFKAESLDAEAKGDRPRAMAMAGANVRLGILMCRNSLYIDCLVGYAIMGVGRGYFVEKRAVFTGAEARKAEKLFLRLEREHEEMGRIVERDRAFSERAFGWQGRLSYIQDSDYDSPRDMQRAFDYWLATNRLLATDLAIRQYRKTQGKWPESIVELVPEYLEKILIDPYSDASFVYRIEGEEFVLYSVGQDKVDNGGRLGSMSELFSAGFDLDLDTFTRPQGTIVEPKVFSEIERGRGEEHEDAKGTKGKAG